MFDLLKHDGNYLRVRGEYWPRVLWRRVCRELPPRARRIRHHRGHSQNREGTTSACAENTDLVVAVAPLLGNYLRVRGEYAFCNILSAFIWELPPRARRIPDYLGDEALPVGTTSACAENTPTPLGLDNPPRNYLRVRGKYCSPVVDDTLTMELPPRARKIPRHSKPRYCMWGTTSACAENTIIGDAGAGFNWNYLRVRGKYARVFR